ncbi:MAG: RNA polymerase sigma factor RpoE [Methylotenera sp. 24-45-7]|jgi:RNA polymerase sigma-70 factor (ECF subfamily)|nr:MAG: RNA polymerase sigma factor RpoE [Mehylophilales bacterium 35-46-6]OYZ41099.1 MAG: RNA polymerase sigma factor RpoE [Methylotenera sp. 24-45-7]OZA09623.1 MAG: RNA polymerase sigma factor RpoE [Methylotenera sp. 17-45-7]OZA48938.1 MAG: RNA polymerase sigma factor RpoE [Methylophilales bacterium 39-45-7]HQS36621.1 RNA polymerase sigma factor RpoE [Methylotenera sp.]
MIQPGKIQEFTQLSFMQAVAQGYTSEQNKNDDKTKQNKHEATGNLSVVATTSNPGNREIDHELVVRAQRGDKRAFGMLVDKYQRKLGRLLSRMIRDQSEIEDVVQESFIKAYRALPNFRGDSAFYTWLYRIGINTAKNYLVSVGRRPTVSTDIEIEDAENFEDGNELRTTETPESSMMTKQIAQTVNDTVEGLPEELRTAITLREIEGLSYEEIATIMGCPIGTVRSRIFRARETIALKLRPLLDTPENKRW